MGKIKIAIIDSGFDNTKLKNELVVSKNFSDEEYLIDKNGHGSCIIKLIDSLCNHVDLYNFKVLKKDSKGSLSALKHALIDSVNYDVDIVNLSLGFDLSAGDAELEEIIHTCFQKNIVIVNTNSNSAARNWLNQYQYIFNIQGGAGLDQDTFYYSAGSFYINNLPRIMYWMNGQYIMTGANSFLTPYMVEKVCGILLCHKMKLDDLKTHIMKESISVNMIENSHKNLEFDRQNMIDGQTTELFRNRIKGLDLYDEKGKLVFSHLDKKTTTELVNAIKEFTLKPFIFNSINYRDIFYIENLTNKINNLLQSEEPL